MFKSARSLIQHGISQTFQISIDVVGLVDEWAARFFEELDYVNEGENGTLFAEMMKEDLPQVVTDLLITVRSSITYQIVQHSCIVVSSLIAFLIFN